MQEIRTACYAREIQGFHIETHSVEMLRYIIRAKVLLNIGDDIFSTAFGPGDIIHHSIINHQTWTGGW
jgi:hypothetical protein